MASQNAARSTSPVAVMAKQSPAEPKTQAVPWRQRPLLSMTEGSQIAAVSAGTLYGMANRGEITLKRFGGRTMIETASLAAALDGAEAWTPSARTEKANAARAERARAAWAE